MIRALVIICLLTFSMVPAAWSEPDAEIEEPHRWLSSFSVMSGYGVAPLDKNNSDYEVVPILPQLGFDIHPLAEKIHIRPKGLLELIVEPLMNLVISPSYNAEIGFSLLLRYSDKVTSRIAPYFEGGLGFIYTTQHTHE